MKPARRTRLEGTHEQFLDDGALRERNGEPHARGDVLGAHHLGAGLGWRRGGAFV